MMPINFCERIDEINQHLPKKVRVLGAKRVTKFLDPKNTYAYLMPPHALPSMKELTTSGRNQGK